MLDRTFKSILIFLLSTIVLISSCGRSEKKMAEAELRRIDSLIFNATPDQKEFNVHGPVKTIALFHYSYDCYYSYKDSIVFDESGSFVKKMNDWTCDDIGQDNVKRDSTGKVDFESRFITGQFLDKEYSADFVYDEKNYLLMKLNSKKEIYDRERSKKVLCDLQVTYVYDCFDHNGNWISRSFDEVYIKENGDTSVTHYIQKRRIEYFDGTKSSGEVSESGEAPVIDTVKMARMITEASPDLRIKELVGPVKSVKIKTWQEIFSVGKISKEWNDLQFSVHFRTLKFTDDGILEEIDNVTRDDQERIVKLGRAQYFYDQGGNIDHIKDYSYGSATSTFRYDATNRISYYCKDGYYRMGPDKYECMDFQYLNYDENGNWTKSVCSVHEKGRNPLVGTYEFKGRLITEREIEYY